MRKKKKKTVKKKQTLVVVIGWIHCWDNGVIGLLGFLK